MPNGSTHAIADEFSALPCSRQRKYQLRREARGLCRLCGKPAAEGSGLCEKHRAKQVQWNRASLKRLAKRAEAEECI